ncbi:hypothetical protein ACTFIU_004283 [Dictyostelium citrinum]
MKVKNSFLVLVFISFLFFNVKSQDQSPITLIVNPNINNTYIVGEKCGIETFTCNSISDAVAYFNSIAILVDNGTIYQQLNLKLSNGTYGIKESQVELFQFNCSISPLESEGEVIFNGDINALLSTQSMFQINENNNSTSITSVLFSGLNFNNFNHSVIKVSTLNSYTNVEIDHCNFYNFQTQQYNNLISFTRLYLPTNDSQPSNFTFSNSIISNVTNAYNGFNSTYSNLIIYTSGINLTLNNVNVSDVDVGKVIETDFSVVNIINCQFNNIQTYIGAIYSSSSDLVIENSVFTSLLSISASVVNLLASMQKSDLVFNMKNCQVYNCISESNGGVFYFSNYFNSKNVQNGIIENSFFKNNNGSKGGVLNGSNYPIVFNNCTFDSNVAQTGSIFDIIGGSITVTNSSIINVIEPSHENSDVFGGTVVVYKADILFDGNTFGNDYFSINCFSSNITIINSKNLNPFYICNYCNQLTVDSKSICKDSSTTSTLNFDSSHSSHGSHSSTLKLIPDYSISNLILLANAFITFFIII